jgi:hypothetical protein
MFIKSVRNVFGFIISLSLSGVLPVICHAADIELNDLALPSEVKDLNKTTGAIYYSSTNKNKTLMPVHFWGEVGRSGLHYIPVDTKLVKGLSFAGGGSNSADLSEVVINRLDGKNVKRMEFNLSEGGDIDAHEYTLRPGDTVYIPKDRFYENRAYYTSLVAVAVAILSSVLLYYRIQDIDRND